MTPPTEKRELPNLWLLRDDVMRGVSKCKKGNCALIFLHKCVDSDTLYVPADRIRELLKSDSWSTQGELFTQLHALIGTEKP